MGDPPRASRSGRPSSYVLIRAEGAPFSGRDETVRPRDRARSRPLRQRPLNGEAPGLNLTLLVPQLPADQPSAAGDGGREEANYESQHADHRVDEAVADEGPREGLRTGRVVVVAAPVAATSADSASESDEIVEGEVVANSHFRSDLSRWARWRVVGHNVSHNVNTMLLQYAPNLLSTLRIHARNTNTTLNLAITVLNNFELKRDAIQPKNDLPAQ